MNPFYEIGVKLALDTLNRKPPPLPKVKQAPVPKPPKTPAPPKRPPVKTVPTLAPTTSVDTGPYGKVFSGRGTEMRQPKPQPVPVG